MEAAAQTAGGPAPFLLKTYDMVDDASTDDIVSWSDTCASFVVWNPPDFAARLLPTYFKHSNFSSFIRQLNTYGFRKIDPERWEFANEDFIKGHKDLLKNIHRRKPIHSHSHPPGGGPPDAERSALEEEIERHTREKAALQADLLRFREQQPVLRDQIDGVERRLHGMELRQQRMLDFLERAVHSPFFVENLVKMAGTGADFSAIHKKRRLPPGSESCLEVAETSFFDNHSSTSKPEIGHVFQQDLCDKLKLELSPAISDCHLVSASTQSSNEEEGSPQGKQQNCGIHLRMECLSLVPETLELSDTGTSFCPRKNVLFPRMVDESDGLNLCHLNLTLASTLMQIDMTNHCPSTNPDLEDQGAGGAVELRTRNKDREEDLGSRGKDINVSSQRDTGLNGNKAPAVPQTRVNDVFWEQFLTERPGSSDAEEASSSLRANLCDEQHEEGKEGDESMWKNGKDMEQLTL